VVAVAGVFGLRDHRRKPWSNGHRVIGNGHFGVALAPESLNFGGGRGGNRDAAPLARRAVFDRHGLDAQHLSHDGAPDRRISAGLASEDYGQRFTLTGVSTHVQ